MTLDIGVLISGRGTNLQSILDAIDAGTLDARVRLVLSNKASAAGLERAQKAGVATEVISHRGFDSREAFDAALVARLLEAGVEWVVLAGFMRVLTPRFLDAFANRVVNIHPALTPAFPGLDAQQQALDYGARVTGCTVHLVDAGVDSGPVLAQMAIPVLHNDTRESLGDRLLVEEHLLLVSTLQRIAQGSLRLSAGEPGSRPRVWLEEAPPEE
ncbi:phosphoribosylglycinamide formyltransferase [Endomicrobium sp. AH-315-J14]|nr:phosphoribosylglycinamide formyltransferase [Endomicrobium sp. AH-315-J14]